ncbi:MAG: RNA-binding S4 domain-containing protein [Bacteroidetes bacterium]|nr:RNA-binding S4 domain-containing protein [Bacteroidota bacterium]
MEEFKITGEYIQLNQLLKVIGWCDQGSNANAIIEEGLVKVNGVVETRKRNKIYPKMEVTFNKMKVKVV